MPTTTMLDQATAMIENAWGQPIEALEVVGVRRPSEDPLLRCAMHTRAALAITDSAVTVHQDRLHALSRHGYVPDFYELDRITETAVKLRVAHAESRAYLQAIRRVVEAREAAAPEVKAPAVRLAQAAVARSGQTRHAPGVVPEPSSPEAVVGPPAATTGPRR
ncbi:hypothetical protein [Streptomyces sp. NBC_01285]|uniref:hypothetical protein n=1 Tax=Streptomyces sp. NBC_01285 TaxID=2903813 RepID=UPI00225B4C53|nr:hypothetical protein [Streptomyces sp. NBC_01285]MCX4775121.1 hypothetical protein [Streptomyces sp. NBC_01285]